MRCVHDDISRGDSASTKLRRTGASAVVTPRPPVSTMSRPATEHLVGDDQVSLRSGARRMVEALGRLAPLQLTKSQWGTEAGLKTSGGTWATYLSDIRRAGLLKESRSGYMLSTAGFSYLRGRPAPMTPTELQQHYRQILRAGAVKMMDALLDAYPAGLTRGELGDAAGLTITGGTFSTYLSDLNRNKLTEHDRDCYRASDVLVNGPDAGQ